MKQDKKYKDHLPGTALRVMEGVHQPGQVSEDALKKLRARRGTPHTFPQLVEGILIGDRTLLSKAITLVESALPAHQEMAQQIIAECLKERGTRDEGRGTKDHSSLRIGITGVPGVGKSTFIEALGKHLTAKGHKLAVLAIDPSSTRSKGSILGDKTRMEELAVDPNAFIRPSPSAGSLGGVARKTRETIILCEAAGFDVIFIETVGVGQSETSVHSMVDFFLLLMLAGAGDELQGIKRGIIEMADAIVVNKADGDNLQKARSARVEYANALHLFPPSESGWTPVADICSSRTKEGIERVWEIILEYRAVAEKTGYFSLRRQQQNRQILSETIESELRHRFFTDPKISRAFHEAEGAISKGIMNPYQAAKKLLEKYYQTNSE